jgi:hypothetical protein
MHDPEFDELTVLPGFEELAEIFSNARIRFWVCPTDEHRERRDVVTVEWVDGIAHCTADGCTNTSARPRDDEPEEGQ